MFADVLSLQVPIYNIGKYMRKIRETITETFNFLHFLFKHFNIQEELDMLKSDIKLDIIALIVIFFVLRVAAFLFLRWKLKKVR